MTPFKQIRASMKLSQEQMASLLHISRKTYGMYERGERQASPRVLSSLSELVHLPSEYYLRPKVKRPALPRNPEEEELLRVYRSLDQNGKRFVYETAVFEQPLSEIYLGHRSPLGR